MILDWRTQADYSRLIADRKAKIVNGRVAMRAPGDVTGITWHITDVHFGAGREAIRLANGDETLARNRRALGVAAHVIIFRDGTVVVPFDLLAFIHHGNGLNLNTIGIEVELLCGEELTPAQVAACFELVAWLMREAPKQGIRLREAWGHRQSNQGKPDDPGPIVWKNVVVPTSERHGLTRPLRALSRSSTSTHNGSAIPPSWETGAGVIRAGGATVLDTAEDVAVGVGTIAAKNQGISSLLLVAGLLAGAGVVWGLLRTKAPS